MSNPEHKLAVNGILLVNKPQGLSSNAVLQQVKRLYQAKKAGHTGSLDPLATGMLPVCFGEATKISQYLLNAGKSYQATGLLGVQTDSADAMGKIISVVEQVNVTHSELQRVICDFVGTTSQTPSMFSALKHQGKPLYKLARQGISIERPARDIVIDSIELEFFDGRSFTIRVSCSKGTYIRNLVEDIGETLGVHAHVTQLHRNFTAGFSGEKMYSLDELLSMSSMQRLDCLMPMERAVSGMAVILLSGEEVLALQHGKSLTKNPSSPETCVRLHDDTNTFIGLGILDADGLLKSKRLLAHGA